jgi:hypothetical protein
MGLPPGEIAPDSPRPAEAAGVPGIAAGEPGVVGTRPATGDDRVDEAVARLSGLAGLPVAGHPAVFEYVHERLTAALGDLDVHDPAGPGSLSRPGIDDAPGSRALDPGTPGS